MPQALQKCSARMVPQDQQDAVTSPGMIRDELDLFSRLVINKSPRKLTGRAAEIHSPGASKVAPWCKNLGCPSKRSQAECPRGTYAVKELPQPQDLVEFGFTKTKPCCISVSW